LRSAPLETIGTVIQASLWKRYMPLQKGLYQSRIDTTSPKMEKSNANALPHAVGSRDVRLGA
jgi:hypothetical protein